MFHVWNDPKLWRESGARTDVGVFEIVRQRDGIPLLQCLPNQSETFGDLMDWQKCQSRQHSCRSLNKMKLFFWFVN